MGKIAQSIQARVVKLAGEPTAPSTPAAEAASALESPASTGVAAQSDSGAGSASADAPAAPVASSPEADEGAAKRELLAEKLASLRERRAAQGLQKRAKEAAAQAEADRKAAAEERAKYDGLKNGTFLDTIKALGKDPKAVFQEMVEEAKKAGTPEAQIELMNRRFEQQLASAVEPLKKTIEQLEEERKARDARDAEQAARRVEHTFVEDFGHRVVEPAWSELRVEYGDQRLLRLADNLRRSPQELFTHARQLGVKLTHDDGRFTMSDILSVLKAAHVAHESEKTERRNRMQPAQSPGESPSANQRTVNGAIRRDAESNPLGNDSAASRASAPAARNRLSKQGRIERAMARDAQRRG